MTYAYAFTALLLGYLLLAGATVHRLTIVTACAHLAALASLSGLCAGAWWGALGF
jgi:hypothetical protein